MDLPHGQMQIDWRPMTAADLAEAQQLSAAVGWVHRREDWQFALDIGQGVVARVDGRIAGTAMWWVYEATVARLGMVIVDPARQGLGLGKALMRKALDSIETPTIILNATAAGEPLYRRLGFVAGGTVMQHQGVATALAPLQLPPGVLIRPGEIRDRQAIHDIDASAAGFRREAVIAHLLANAESAVLETGGAVSGFAIRRRFGLGYAVGPVVARDDWQARALMAHWIAATSGKFLRFDLPSEMGMSKWLDHQGLREIAPAITMARGRPAPAGHTYRSFGLINQALG